MFGLFGLSVQKIQTLVRQNSPGGVSWEFEKRYDSGCRIFEALGSAPDMSDDEAREMASKIWGAVARKYNIFNGSDLLEIVVYPRSGQQILAKLGMFK